MMAIAEPVVWSLPPAGEHGFGVADRTALYPSLMFDGAGIRPLLSRKADARVLEAIAPVMRRAAARHSLRFVIVAPKPEAIERLAAELGAPAQIVAESDNC